jgi:hypothetical protein
MIQGVRMEEWSVRVLLYAQFDCLFIRKTYQDCPYGFIGNLSKEDLTMRKIHRQ